MTKYKVGDIVVSNKHKGFTREILHVGDSCYFYKMDDGTESSWGHGSLEKYTTLVKPEPECLGELAYHKCDGAVWVSILGSLAFERRESSINFTRVTLRGNKVYKYE